MTSRDKREDPEQYQSEVAKICDTYLSASHLAAEGAHVISTDEKTGMQALERLHPTKPTRPGLAERMEFEYVRHGTLCLLANFDVATGNSAALLAALETAEPFVIQGTDRAGLDAEGADDLGQGLAALEAEVITYRA